ncbi:MAG: Oxygen sensor histidine kinase NreB [Anaerolineales bacterium]|nr:Oxygen sensor histidine kinase NreB [Anaerolineales bacterium]
MTKPGAGAKRFEDLLTVMPYAAVIVDQQGRIAMANSLAENLLGYGPNELPGRPVEILVPERFRDQHLQHRASYVADPRLRPMAAGLDLYGRRQDGSEFPSEIALTPLPGEWGPACRAGTGRLFVLVVIRDISDRKAKEDKLRHSREQLRELSARLLSIREEERTRISRAIHDELGQALTGLKMDVAWLQRHLDEDRSTLLHKTKAMSELIDTTIQTVRRISTELRPAILDDMGLVPALEWQLQEFQARTGIQCRLVCTVEETTLDADGCTTAFRILQEALTNVARHAAATQVEAQLEETAGHLTLRVQDNGRGITEREIDDPQSIGLLGMRERALSHGGEVEIDGTAGKGTTVTARLPVCLRTGRPLGTVRGIGRAT